MKLFQFDAEYVERLCSGDSATERHFTEYFTELIGIKLRARRYAPALLEDIRQETFLRVLQAVRDRKLRDPLRLGSYVNSVCNHVALEQHRSEGRHPQADPEMPEPADVRAGPETELLSAEEGGIVRLVLKEIPVRSRDILSALFLEERTSEEVCRMFKVDQNYLRVLLFRARNQFRAALQNRDPRQIGDSRRETDRN